MANSAIDSNSNPTMTALLNTNGSTITRVKVNASNHRLKVSDGTTGSDNGGNHGFFDDNQRTTLFVVSNADGVSPLSLYADSSGNLLIKST